MLSWWQNLFPSKLYLLLVIFKKLDQGIFNSQHWTWDYFVSFHYLASCCPIFPGESRWHNMSEGAKNGEGKVALTSFVPENVVRISEFLGYLWDSNSGKEQWFYFFGNFQDVYYCILPLSHPSQELSPSLIYNTALHILAQHCTMPITALYHVVLKSWVKKILRDSSQLWTERAMCPVWPLEDICLSIRRYISG